PGTDVDMLQTLRALVLLGGSVRPSRLSGSIGRPVFDLPLETGCTILDAWRREAAELLCDIGLSSLPIRVMIDRGAPEALASARDADGPTPVVLERDPFDYRGTGGVLRDLAASYHDDDLLLVANASQVALEPLSSLARELAATRGDVSII